jgi:hypothetical protein
MQCKKNVARSSKFALYSGSDWFESQLGTMTNLTEVLMVVFLKSSMQIWDSALN